MKWARMPFVHAPWTIFASLDLLDLSMGGTNALERALEEYENQMDATEELLAHLLHDKLTSRATLQDMAC